MKRIADNSVSHHLGKIKDEDVTTQMHDSVSGLLNSISSDDTSFVDQFKERVRSREMVKTLQTLRVSENVTQSQIADELKCGQGKISKLENGFDDDLKLRDIEGYARVLGKGVHIQFAKKMSKTQSDAFEQMDDYKVEDDGMID